MKILIVSATEFEISATLNFLKIEPQNNKKIYSCDFFGNEINVLITGIGCYSAVYSLTKHLSANNYDLVINAGIAGTFDSSLKIGEVVFVKSEQIGDLGVNDNGNFNTAFEKNFCDKNSFPYTDGKLVNSNTDIFNLKPNLKQVDAISVNTVSGEKIQIEKLQTKFGVQIESMEGAAFHYVCLQEGVKFIQIRSISNNVKPRNEEKWEIHLGINNLNETLRVLLFELLK